jgi:hydroxymethylpyrimidine kinase/phosphomethylpyrimidine kinase
MVPSQSDGPSIVVVGGVDPGQGAGLLRDCATARALGARPRAVETAWTKQGDGVHSVEACQPGAVRAQLALALAEARPAALKIGMAVGPATAEALLGALAAFEGPIVVDPVLASSRGGPLWSGQPRELLPLLRRATLATPNAPEAAALTGGPVATLAGAEAAGRALVDAGVAAVLVKGGHLADRGSDRVTDVLVTGSGAKVFQHRRVPGPGPRGTGCALATAIAVEIGRGRSLEDAIQAATDWLAAAIASARPVGNEWHL